MTTGSATPGGWRLPRAVVVKAAVLGAVAILPALAALLVAGPGAAVGVGLGLGAGVGIASMLPVPAALGAVAVHVCVAALGTLAVGTPLGAAALAGIAGLALGPANRRGVGRAFILLPMLAAITSTGVIAGDAVRGLAGLAVGATWPVVVLAAARVRGTPQPLDPRRGWIHAAVLAATASVATYVALAVPLPHGYWIVVTLCAVLVPVPGEAGRATIERVAGTLAGALVGVVGGVLLPGPLLAVAGLAALVLVVAYALAGDGRRKVLWLTVLTVLLLGGLAGAGTVEIAVQRLAWTVAGAALVAVAAAVVAVLDQRLARPERARGPAPRASVP